MTRQKSIMKDVEIGCIHRLIDFEVFLQLRYTEMLLIYNSNGKLENVKAEVGHTAERHSLLELESLQCRLRCPKCPKVAVLTQGTQKT